MRMIFVDAQCGKGSSGMKRSAMLSGAIATAGFVLTAMLLGFSGTIPAAHARDGDRHPPGDHHPGDDDPPGDHHEGGDDGDHDQCRLVCVEEKGNCKQAAHM